jgi:hypothetical protein
MPQGWFDGSGKPLKRFTETLSARYPKLKLGENGKLRCEAVGKAQSLYIELRISHVAATSSIDC